MIRTTITTVERRARLLARHHLDASAPDALTAVRSLVAMHSSDPVTPHLGVLARVGDHGPASLDAALYEARTLWRLHAMRRTLWVVPSSDAHVFDAAVGRDVAVVERRRLEGWLAAVPLDTEVSAWVTAVEDATVAALADGAELRTQELTALVPELATRITLGSGRSRVDAPLSSRLLFLLAMDGRVVRSRPVGTWRSSQYRWASRGPVPASDGDGARVWDDGQIGALDAVRGRTELARRYLGAFGPVTLIDLRWWTGWTAARARAALTAIEAEPVGLDDGAEAFVLPDDVQPVEPLAPGRVTFLPGLDPTAMGWKQRDWYLGPHAEDLFDTNGNVGPTIWLDGRIVGGWAQRTDGRVVTRVLEPVGRAATVEVQRRAELLTAWLDGTVVIPRFRTPLERALVTG